MQNDCLLSIIVPVYNTEKYLERCLNSLLLQTFGSFEIIIIDDGSTDISGYICEFYKKKDSRINVLHTNNNGLSTARNIGIELSKGKYIGFVDSDDWVESKMFEKLIKNALQYNADISACNMYKAISKDTKTPKNEKTEFNADDHLFFEGEEVLKNFYMLFSVCNKIFSNVLFSDIKFPEGKIFEDARIMCKLALKSKIAVFDKYNGYNYFVRENSITNNYTREFFIDKIIVWDEIAGVVLPYLPEERDYIWARKAKVILEALAQFPDSIIELNSVLKLRYVFASDYDENRYLNNTEKQIIKEISRKL